MNRRWMALTLAALLVLPGCAPAAEEPDPTPQPTPTPSPTATPAPAAEFSLPCYPAGGFHPIAGSNRLNLTLSPLMYRGLFALDRAFNPRGDLCESYEVSEDGLTWTFLVKETDFSDGTALTAAHVVSSLNAACRSDRYSTRLKDVERVTAADDRTVTVKLSRPNGALTALLDVPVYLEGEDPQRPLGTGPYALSDAGTSLELLAREGTDAPWEKIRLTAVSSDEELIRAFGSREITLVDTDLTGTNVPGYSGLSETTDYPTSTLLYVGCNTADGPCRDRAVRQAVARALDRERVAGELLEGHAAPSALPVYPYTADYDAALAGELAYDREEAEAILAGAGWSRDGEGYLADRRGRLTLELVVNQENTYKVAVAGTLRGWLEELGCQVILTKLPWDDYIKALEKGEFDLCLGECLLTADFELEGLVGSKGTLNYGGWADKTTDALLDARRGAMGEERQEAAGKLWTHLNSEVPIIPLCFKNGSVLSQWGQVKGMTPTQRDIFAGISGWMVPSEG